MKLWVALALLIPAASAPVRADGCVAWSLNDILRYPSKAVFRGVVTANKDVQDGQLVTLRVDRVWKGSVPPDVVIYQQQRWPLYPGVPRPALAPFVVGKSYLVSSTLSDDVLAQFGVSFGVQGSADQCLTRELTATGNAIGDEPGNPPQ